MVGGVVIKVVGLPVRANPRVVRPAAHQPHRHRPQHIVADVPIGRSGVRVEPAWRVRALTQPIVVELGCRCVARAVDVVAVLHAWRQNRRLVRVRVVRAAKWQV